MNKTTSPKEAPIGLIGTGLMGTAIAERLLAAECRVLAWDIDAAQLAASRAEGAADASVVARNCDRIVLSLPDSQVVDGVIGEMSGHLRRGTVILDTSTGKPEDAVRFAAGLQERGVTYLDATISGSSEQVRRGQALVMVGGDEAAQVRCRDIFAALGAAVAAVGGSGDAARMKLVTNLVLGLNRAALAEGLALAENLGLDAEMTAAILKTSAAYSRIMDSKAEKMIHRDFSPVARVSQHLKDVELMLRAGEMGGLELPLTKTHREILTRAVAAGLGDLDNSAIVEVLRRGNP
ncbi:MAG: NAD(P)-dependent oxidoreductase [Verrucomicrobiales bacterium]